MSFRARARSASRFISRDKSENCLGFRIAQHRDVQPAFNRHRHRDVRRLQPQDPVTGPNGICLRNLLQSEGAGPNDKVIDGEFFVRSASASLAHLRISINSSTKNSRRK